jgi:hypothetical protein
MPFAITTTYNARRDIQRQLIWKMTGAQAMEIDFLPTYNKNLGIFL